MTLRRVLGTLAIAASSVALAAPAARAETQTFSFTGGEQVFIVPAQVTSLHVVAVGGRGGAGKSGAPPAAAGGFGAVASGDVAVTPGQTLYVEVGGNGKEAPGMAGGEGGFNGGAAGGSASNGLAWGGGGGGGGASDVRAAPGSVPGSLASRLIVAAGGGGGGGVGAGEGGAGGAGGAAGGNGGATEFCSPAGGGGEAGTQAQGGAGGTAASGGVAGTGGSAGNGGPGGASTEGSPDGGGGGGGGLYGGGGGGSSCGSLGAAGGGGGGGSSGFASSVSGTALTTDTSGVPSVTITYTVGPDTTAPALKSLLLTPTAFEAANIGPPAISAAVGTNVIYELSEPATVIFTVQRAAKGFKKGRKCVAKKPAGKTRRCVRYVAVKGSFTDEGAQGLNRLRFTGRMRNKSLAPGKYRLTAIGRDAGGNRSKPKSRGFRIVAAR